MVITLGRMLLSEIKPLEEVLAYHNEAVIQDFLQRFDMPYDEACSIFKETLKWMWLCAKSRGSHRVFIDETLLIIDHMWHAFILFTHEYHRFCEAYLGGMVHHLPTTYDVREASKKRREADPDAWFEIKRQEYRNFYTLVYDHLGEDTVKQWFMILAKQYTPDYIQKISVSI